MRLGIYLFFCMVFVLCALPSCTSVDRKEEMEAFRKELREDHQNMSRMEEANLDDDLNPVERKAVHQVFEKNRKETERTEKAIF